MGNIFSQRGQFKILRRFSNPKPSKSSKSFQSSQSSEISENTSQKNVPLKYYLANVEKDTDIMVILHFLGCYLFQSIFNAPVKEKMATQENCQVLDVG